jgi:hypothetical protein
MSISSANAVPAGYSAHESSQAFSVSSTLPPASSVIAPIPILRHAAGGGDPFDFPLPSSHPNFTMSPKYTCICMPCQSGKTRNMQELMLNYHRMAEMFYPDGENYINIVICSKNLNLVQQTEARMKKDLFSSPTSEEDDDSDTSSADAKIDGDIFSWMSGTKKNDITARDLYGRIIDEDIRMIVCCAHKKRLEYVSELLAILDRSKVFKQRVNIWMDEADDYVNLWSDNDFSRFHKVNHIHLVTATLDSIVERFGRIKIHAMPTTFPKCYHKTRDSRVVELEVSTRGPLEYIEAVYAIHGETLSAPGMRVFAPGDLTVKSHDAISDFLRSKGFAVCILNGRKKCIYVPGSDKPLYIADYLHHDEIMEVGKVIARIYRDEKLSRFPFAITGKICLGRGITFNCEEFMTYLTTEDDGTLNSRRELDFDFMFDAAIVPTMRDRATLYQCASRVNGNILNFVNYAVPTVYMTADTHKTILDAEAVAMNLPVMVYTHKLSDVGKEEMNWAIHGDIEKYREEKNRSMNAGVKKEVPCRIYADEKTAREVLAFLYPTYSWRGRKQVNGFYEAAVGRSSQVNSLEHVLANAHNLTGGKEGAKNQTATVWVPCYKNVTDASTLRYVVIVKKDLKDKLPEVDAKWPQTL